MLDRYGAELEYDFLALFRIDIAEFFRGERGWLQFHRLVGQLPRNSRFQAAWHSDPEAAREHIRRNPELVNSDSTPTERPTRALNEWSPEVELLTALVNEIRGYRADYAYVSANGKGSRKKPDLVEGPRTALESELKKARQDRHSGIKAALLPHRYNASSTEGS